MIEAPADAVAIAPMSAYAPAAKPYRGDIVEQFWRRTGVALGKQWKIVTAALVVITVLLVALGIPNLKFATGQDSYLNPDSQIAIDNVKFQSDFGGETVILLFTANEDGVDVSDLYVGDNLAELERLNGELAELVDTEGVYAVITPRTSIEFSHQLLSQGIGTNALLAAAGRDEAGAEARNADIAISLARLGAAGDQTVGNPSYNELLIFGNDGYTVVDGEPVAPPAAEREIRLSLASTFPNPDPAKPNQTAVGGIILDGNASLDEQSAATVAVLEILDTASFDGFDLTVTGSPVYLKVINDYLKGGMVTLGAAALAVMAVILALIFRVRWRLLPLLAVLFGVTWAFAIVGIVGIDLSLVTISGLPILIGLGIDFAIQIHNRVEEEVVLDHDEHPIAETLSNVAPPLIVATIAAILAFLALQISKVPMIRDFGVLLSIGVAVLVITGIVIPGMVLGLREFKTPTKQRGESVVERVVVWLGGLPTAAGPILIALATVIFVGGVLAEGSAEIQSDPVKWIDQDSEVVADINRLEDETGFSTTLGILVNANNVYDQDVIDLVWDFTLEAEAEGSVVSSSSLVNTMGKIIAVDGATPIAPTSDDIVAADAVMPPDIARVLVNGEAQTATQVNLRLAPASLAERADIVAGLEADLAAKVAALELPDDSILLVDLQPGQDAVRATPAGLATVGIGLLENLSANRANLTYLSLFVVGIFLVLRFRSLTRSVLALVPVLLAVGVSSLVVGLSGIQLSPLTTVSGPLVVATCAEFSVLILGRYLEERQRGLDPRAASAKAAGRTGRAFFTSALTTIGGFAVLIGSALPLLRDFGIIVTLNVAIALLAALVVMPPLSVWVDARGWLGTGEQDRPREAAVALAAPLPGSQTVGAAVGGVAMLAGAIGVYATADTSSGQASDLAYAAVPLPTTTTTTTTTTTLPPTTTVAGQEPPPSTEPAGPLIDPSGFPTEPPTEGIVAPILFGLLTDQGVEPNVANCAITTLLERFDEPTLLGLGLAEATPESVAPVSQAAIDCGIAQETVDAAILAFTGG